MGELKSKAKKDWKQITCYDQSKIARPSLDCNKVVIDLKRIVGKSQSNLNVYFGKGREQSNGLVSPRPWYEIEVICSKMVTDQYAYPRGDFIAYTDDGYVLPMKTGGDYNKNLRSKGGLQNFGIWLKGKLERSGALEKFTPITEETLREYGENKLTLYQLSEGKYYMEF